MFQVFARPFVVLYIAYVRIRLLVFGNQLKINYLPKEYSSVIYPAVLDPFWFKNGVKGLGLVHIPKGIPSLRYIE